MTRTQFAGCSSGFTPPIRRLLDEGAQAPEHHLHQPIARRSTGGRAGLLIHRRNVTKRSVPSSQVILTDPDLLAELAGPVTRALASRGSLMALRDVDQTREPTAGRVFRRGIRYFKGADAPRVGDLSYSELAAFGP